jgi:hypothetical protein
MREANYWELQVVVNSACSLVEFSLTLRAEEDLITQRRCLGQLACLTACTMRAIHGYSLAKD